MKTFVAENVLYDYTAGMVVVKAENIEKAIKVCKAWFSYDIDDPEFNEISERIRELKDNEVVFVKGGG